MNVRVGGAAAAAGTALAGAGAAVTEEPPDCRHRLPILFDRGLAIRLLHSSQR